MTADKIIDPSHQQATFSELGKPRYFKPAIRAVIALLSVVSFVCGANLTAVARQSSLPAWIAIVEPIAGFTSDGAYSYVAEDFDSGNQPPGANPVPGALTRRQTVAATLVPGVGEYRSFAVRVEEFASEFTARRVRFAALRAGIDTDHDGQPDVLELVDLRSRPRLDASPGERGRTVTSFMLRADVLPPATLYVEWYWYPDSLGGPEPAQPGSGGAPVNPGSASLDVPFAFGEGIGEFSPDLPRPDERSAFLGHRVPILPLSR